MLLIDIRSTNASAAEFILYRLKLYLAGRHHHHRITGGNLGKFDFCKNGALTLCFTHVIDLNFLHGS